MPLRSPFALRTTVSLVMAGCWALVAGGACGGHDSTGPTSPSPTAFLVGDTVAGSVTAPDTEIVYRVHPTDGYYAVFLQTLSGTIGLTISYAGNPTVLATAISFPGRVLLDNATEVFWGQGDVEIRLTRRVSSQATFRFVMLPVNTAPENHAAALTVGDTVNDETLATMADIDEFTFSGKASQQIVAQIQALRPAGTGTIEVDLIDPSNGHRFGLAKSSGGDSTFDIQSTGVISLPADRLYHATVHSLRAQNVADSNYTGPYRLAILGIDSAPELASPVVSSWDTVSDAISPIGDVDVFTFSGTAGQEFNLFMQARSGSANDIIHATIPTLGTTYSLGSDTSLLRQYTGRFALPSSGQFKIVVYGDDPGVGGDRGRYRFSLYPIDRRPEHSKDTLALTDSVLGERIEFPGDVDEFHVIVPDTTIETLLVQRGADATSGAIRVLLIDSAGHVLTGASSDSANKYVQNSVVVGPGTFMVRAEGGEAELQPPGSFVGGSYRLWLVSSGVRPELTPDTIAIGDTISTETLYPLGDVDRYVFHGKKGDHFSLELQGTAPAGPGGFEANLTDQFSSSYSVLSPEAGDSLGGHQTNRIDIDHDGWYQLTISGGAPPPRSTPEPYRFALVRRSPAPEVASPTLTLGDSVTGEALDYPGDWDGYTLTGPPGQSVYVVGQNVGANGFPLLRAFDTSTGVTLLDKALQDVETVSDTFAIPASGELEIAVRQARGGGDYNCFDPVCGYGITGPYRFVILPFNPAPESVPATFALGDTVRGESLSPAGDVDEFTSSATPGDSLVGWFRLTAATNPPGQEINMEIVDPATGVVLAGTGVSPLGPSTDFIPLNSFRVPASGNYEIRVRQYVGAEGNPATTAQYEFFVARAP